ncbi:CHAT domain-containing protein, partial [Flavobacteriaceae bacterium]|nr:CHAT domain-containing protein [Flavobacteriaceae bacterium]
DSKNKKSTPKKPTRSGLYQLPSTRIEVESINKILKQNNINTISLLGEEATEINFKNNLRKDLIHIATHGFYKVEEDFPTFGLFFANSGNSKLDKEKGDPLFNDNDNVLRDTELKYINLSDTELLVLSACETAVSYSLMIGNYNLSEEFIRSGVKNVISTIWKVDDNVTQKFMTIFYELLSKGNSINSSLKSAKSKIREDYPHPYYWAPFVLLSS